MCMQMMEPEQNLNEQEHEMMEEVQSSREGFHEVRQAWAQGFNQLIRHCNVSANPMVVAPVRAMPRQLDGTRHICLQVVQVGGIIHVAQEGPDAVCFNRQAV